MARKRQRVNKILQLNKEANKTAEEANRIAKRAQKISIIAIVISFIVGMGGLFIAHFLVEPYLIPRNPVLRIFMNEGETTFFHDFFSMKGSDFTICFANEGRGVTGVVQADWMVDWMGPHHLYIENIEGGNYSCKEILVYPKNCNDKECDTTKLTQGKQDLILNVKCVNCPPPYNNFNQTIEICIYKSNESEECK